MLGLMHGNEVLGVGLCRGQIHGQNLQSLDMKPQVIVHRATSVQGCELILRSGLESKKSNELEGRILEAF